MKTQNRISKKVKRARVKRGWTQETLAEKANLTSRTVINVEGGKGINLGTLAAIAGALECSMADLLNP